MKKTALFAFNGDPLCFIHVLLNARDMHARGMTVVIVLEGASVKLVPELFRAEHPLHSLWSEVLAAGLVAGFCRACAVKLGVFDEVAAQGLTPLSDMSGHAGMASFMADGYAIVTF